MDVEEPASQGMLSISKESFTIRTSKNLDKWRSYNPTAHCSVSIPCLGRVGQVHEDVWAMMSFLYFLRAVYPSKEFIYSLAGAWLAICRSRLFRNFQWRCIYQSGLLQQQLRRACTPPKCLTRVSISLNQTVIDASPSCGPSAWSEPHHGL